MATHYDILGLDTAATPDDIRRAYRREAKRIHPDKAAGTESQMVQLNTAYDTLKDPDKREAYDATLKPAYRLPKRPDMGPPPPDPLAFLATVFQPLDRALTLSLHLLDTAIAELAYDLYDDHYVERFSQAVEQANAALTRIDQRLMDVEWPAALSSGLNMYGQGLRQIEDAVEDFGTFVYNYDTDTLVTGRATIRLAKEVLAEARHRLNV